MMLSQRPDLTGKVVVVTGGTGVLCSVWVDALAACGAKVAVLGRNLAKAEAKAAEVVAQGGMAIALAADVMDPESLKQAHRILLETWGPCDVLINGAGGNNPKGMTTREYLFPEDIGPEAPEGKTFFDLDPTGVRDVFDLNFMGALFPSQEFGRDMVGRTGCTIINVSSMNAFKPLTKIPAYSGAKAAVSNFTQWLAVHMSKVGVRVNAIAPGFFVTQQNAAMLKQADGSWTDRAKKIVGMTPMGRFGEAQELVGALLFLVDEHASGFVNGVILPVDGGFSAYSGV